MVLKEPYTAQAETPDEKLIERTILLGKYKAVPNNVRTTTGETYYFTPPEQVKQAMSDLIDWYRAKEQEGEHPIVIAATFHYRFVRIHPFDDGNGRMARLLMNMILIKHGYTVAMIPLEKRDEYLGTLEQTDRTQDLTEFINYIASSCEYALNLHLKAARGEPIEQVDDIDKEIALFEKSLLTPTGDAFDAREHIDTVLFPFCEYVNEKALLFSDVFASIGGSIELTGTTPEGRAVEGGYISFGDDFVSKKARLEFDPIPTLMRSMSTVLNVNLHYFQGSQDQMPGVFVENSIDANHCRWEFSSDTPEHQWEYEGRDLDELKKQFNRLLREMMKALD